MVMTPNRFPVRARREMRRLQKAAREAFEPDRLDSLLDDALTPSKEPMGEDVLTPADGDYSGKEHPLYEKTRAPGQSQTESTPQEEDVGLLGRWIDYYKRRHRI